MENDGAKTCYDFPGGVLIHLCGYPVSSEKTAKNRWE